MWCFLTNWFAACFTGLCSGCVAGSVASHSAAWNRILSTSSWNGGRLACMSSVSVGEEHMPPTIISAALHCTEANLFSVAHPSLLVLRDALHSAGPKNMSALYNI